MQQDYLKEFVKSREDPSYFMSNYIKVAHPVRGLVKFKLYPFQEKIVEDIEAHRFNILRKFRQAGCTTIAGAYSLHFTNFNSHKTVVILLSLLMSFASYFFIEKPFRNRAVISNKKLYVLLFLSVTSIALFSYFSYKEKGFPNRSQIIFKEEFKEKPWELLKDNNGICHLRTDNFCNFNYKAKKGTVFLIGDSHMITMGKSLSDELVKNDYSFISLTNGGCYYFPKFRYVNSKTNELMFGCDETYQEKRKSLLMNSVNSIAIIGGNLNRYLSNQGADLKTSVSNFITTKNFSLEESLKLSIYELLENNIKVIIVYPIPEVPWDPLTKIYDSSNSRNFNEVKNYILSNNVTTSYKAYEERSKKAFEILNDINHENLFRVFPHKIFCDYNKINDCFIHDKKNIFYFDSEHLSVIGSKMLEKPILEIINGF